MTTTLERRRTVAGGGAKRQDTRLLKGAGLPKPRKEADQRRYSGRLAKRLRSLRESTGKTPNEFAELLTKAGYPIAGSTLYAWENGNLQVQLDSVPFLAKLLKLPAREVFPDK